MTITKQFLNIARKKEEERKKKFIYKKKKNQTNSDEQRSIYIEMYQNSFSFVINLFQITKKKK